MGIIIGDQLTLSNGLSVSNSYCSFADADIRLNKNRHHVSEPDDNSKKYVLQSHYTIWFDKTYRTNKQQSLNAFSLNIYLDDADLNKSVYTILYENLKSKYQNTTDDL